MISCYGKANAVHFSGAKSKEVSDPKLRATEPTGTQQVLCPCVPPRLHAHHLLRPESSGTKEMKADQEERGKEEESQGDNSFSRRI